MDADQQKRFDELKAKASGPGLSGDETNELGKLYAVAAGGEYANAETAGGADLELEEAEDKKLRLYKEQQVAANAADAYRTEVSQGEGMSGV